MVKRFIDSFIQKVDKRITLLVYAEECAPYISNNQQVTLLNANIELPKLVAFKENWKNTPKKQMEYLQTILKHVDLVTGTKNLNGMLYALLIRPMQYLMRVNVVKIG